MAKEVSTRDSYSFGSVTVLPPKPLARHRMMLNLLPNGRTDAGTVYGRTDISLPSKRHLIDAIGYVALILVAKIKPLCTVSLLCHFSESAFKDRANFLDAILPYAYAERPYF